MKYGKLVRDRIPEIIQGKGSNPVTRTLSDDEYAAALEKKLQEEVAEYLSDKNGEELADILEVLYALAARLGISADELEGLRAVKAQEKGTFANRTFLVSVAE